MGRYLHVEDSANLALHPCQTAAHHLPFTRPLALGGRFLQTPPAIASGRTSRQRRPSSFVTTRAGTATMPRRVTEADEDDITEAGDNRVASTFGGASIRYPRQVTPSPMSDDLRTALAPPTTFGTKLFEITVLLAVATTCKVTVKDTGDLLLLCDWIFEEIGSPYMWIIMLSVVEWDTLTAEQKDLYSTAHNLSCTQGGTEAQIPAARPARSCLQARC